MTDNRLKKSIKVYRQMVLEIPYTPPLNRLPEFQAAFRYRKALEREFGEKAVLQAMREVR